MYLTGGAYGGGCSANPTAGSISFFSYRDPNFERTMNVFHNSNEWIQKADNFTQRDVDEAKLNVFKAVDKPILPGNTFYQDFTVRKFQDFLSLRFYVKSIFGDSGTSKTGICCIFRGSEFLTLVDFAVQLSRKAEFHEDK